MRVLGLDPGLAIVGYSILDYTGNRFSVITYDAIRTKAGVPFPERLELIFNELSNVIRKYQPDEMAIEELFFNKNITTAISVAHARGVEVLAAKVHQVPTFEYTPLQIKKAVVGYGYAEKKQVQQMVKTLLNLREVPKPDDVADAVAVAICHCHSLKQKDLFLLR